MTNFIKNKPKAVTFDAKSIVLFERLTAGSSAVDASLNTYESDYAFLSDLAPAMMSLVTTLPAAFPTANGYPNAGSCYLATQAALPANTYNNGTAGVGATLTGVANGALSVDGVVVTVGTTPQFILVKNEAAPANNGIYTVTQVGSGGTPYILTRASWFNSTATAITGIYGVSETGPNGNKRYLFTNPGSITFGTTAINFTLWTQPNLYIDPNGKLALLGWDFAGNGCARYTGYIDVQSLPNNRAMVIEAYNSRGTIQYGLQVNSANGGTALDDLLSVFNHDSTTYYFKVDGLAQITMPGKLLNPLLLNAAAVLNANDRLSLHDSINGVVSMTLENTNTGTGNNTTIYFQNDSGVRVGNITLNGNTSTSLGGANALWMGSVGGLASAGGWKWYNTAGSVLGMTFTSGGGLQVGAAPTGGDKGAGHINIAGDIWKNNAVYTNPDFVIEHWARGKIVRFAKKEGAREYCGLLPLSEVEKFARKRLHLPRFGQKAGHGIFSGSEALLATVEEVHLYLFDHEKRLRTLERKLEMARTRQSSPRQIERNRAA